MKNTGAKIQPLKLDATSYRELHPQVPERDDWRCRASGGMRQLQVYHLKLRSESISDEECQELECQELESIHDPRRMA